jgi:ABC-2 type transport system permease protein
MTTFAHPPGGSPAPSSAQPQPRPHPLLGLLHREWLQQRLGWTLLLLLPTVGLLLLAAFSHLDIDIHNDAGEAELKVSSAALLSTAGVMAAMMVLGLGLALAMALLQAGGLARRDVQDRSIEFWRALPVSDSLAVAAPLLAHLVLMPLAAMLAGLAGALLVSAVAVGRADGVTAWLALPWGLLLPAALVLALRLAAGLLLALLWLSPLVLLVMVASAWLKRWGVPALALALGLGGLVLDKVYGIRVVGRTIGYLLNEALQSMVNTGQHPGVPDLDRLLQQLPWLALQDFGQSLARLAQPGLLAVLAASALSFWLLVWRRTRPG